LYTFYFIYFIIRLSSTAQRIIIHFIAFYFNFFFVV
jgi:hypothetical protein